jgi:hypothetical protein
MFIALAILHGHNVIPHHHHNPDQFHEGHFHSVEDGKSNAEHTSENSDLGHLFSSIQHGDNGLTYSIGQTFTPSFDKQILPIVAFLPAFSEFIEIDNFIQEGSPPYRKVYFNFQNNLPSGLRAPPAFIV